MLKTLLATTLISFTFAANVGVKSQLKPIDSILNGTARSPVLSNGGSIGGIGGGDTTDLRKLAAWYYGHEPIDVCYKITKNFGPTPEQAHNIIAASFKTWAQYFKDKQINSKQERAINTNFNLKSSCAGNEDLVIYLGTGPIFQNLLDLKAAQALNNPIAYTNKTHISEDFTWSRGYIRFVENESYKFENGYYPDWNQLEKFSQMMVHEVGHVLGFSHIPNTLMSSRIVKDLYIDLVKRPETIDLEQELFPCLVCSVEYVIESSQDHKAFMPTTKLTLSQNKITILQSRLLQEINPVHINKQRVESPLISIFADAETMIEINSFYFFNYKNRNLVLVNDGFKLKVFENGNLLATFKRSVL